jgi:hypothetical protein
MKWCALLFIILYIPLLYSQSENAQAYEFKSILIGTDQDMFAPYNEDRNYTMGFEIGLVLNESMEKSPWFVLPKVRQGIDYIFGLKKLYQKSDAANIYLSSMNLLGSGFTPENLTLSGVDTTDRPYGSILALGSTRITAFNEEASNPFVSRYTISTAFYIGILGLDVAKEVQSHIHENQWFGSTRPVPRGWDNQISDGGEPTLLYNVAILSPLVEIDHPEREEFHLFQSVLEMGTQVGYYTNVSAGLQTRIGFHNTPYWMSSGNLINVSQAPVEDLNKKSWFKWFIYTNLRARYVLYNALLQGQFKENVYDLDRSEIIPFVFELELGVSLQFWNKVTLLYKPIVMRTEEYKGANRNHIWGHLSIAYNL